MAVTRENVENVAQRAVEMILALGLESYSQDIRDEDSTLVASPFAAQAVLDITEQRRMIVGPRLGMGTYRVVSALVCNGFAVESYCEVSCDDIRPGLVIVTVYFGNESVRRNVSVKRNGALDPWGMPKGFDLAAATSRIRLLA